MAKILVVEDRTYYARIVEEMLQQRGHQTRWTDASEVAFRYLKEGHPDGVAFDLLVLDVNEIREHPDGPARSPEGIYLLERIRQDEQFVDLPVVGTTIFLDESVQRKWQEIFAEAGGDRFFRHEIDEEEFLATIDELLQSGRNR